MYLIFIDTSNFIEPSSLRFDDQVIMWLNFIIIHKYIDILHINEIVLFVFQVQ